MPTTESDEPLLNGRYRVLGTLGAGGMATVYEAMDEVLRVRRAVKVLSKDMAHREKIRQRFLTEARTMAQLRHANVVTVYDVALEGEQPFIVMEFVEGGSLVDRVTAAGGGLPVAEACALMVGTLRGLQAAHDKGVVHRDIKPHNVLLEPDGTPKVTDFGIASVEDDTANLTKTGVAMGTLAYMPPEQRRSARQVDARADIYASGATLYVLVTGEEPYDLYASQFHDQLFKGVHPGVAAIVKRACRYAPEDRFASADEMREALTSLLSGEDTLVAGVGATSRPPVLNAPSSDTMWFGDDDDAIEGEPAGGERQLGTLVAHTGDGAQPTLAPDMGDGAQPTLAPDMGDGAQPTLAPDMGDGAKPTLAPDIGGGAPPTLTPDLGDGVDPSLVAPERAGAAHTLADLEGFDPGPSATLPDAPDAPDAGPPMAEPAAPAAGPPASGGVPRWIPVVALLIGIGAAGAWFLGRGDPTQPVAEPAERPVPDAEAQPVSPPAGAVEEAAEPTPPPAEPGPDASAPATSPPASTNEPVAAKPAAAPSQKQVAEKKAPQPSPTAEAEERPAKPAAGDAQPAALGKVRINSRPWSRVSLDGKALGRTGWRGELSVGRHRVKLETNDGRSTTMPVVVRADREEFYCWDFDADAECER